jgi:hypothetical protein
MAVKAEERDCSVKVGQMEILAALQRPSKNLPIRAKRQGGWGGL